MIKSVKFRLIDEIERSNDGATYRCRNSSYSTYFSIAYQNTENVNVVKQLDSNEFYEMNLCWTNLSQWMYFECGAWLLYLTKQNQT
jgi:hypothetical protein